MKKRGKWQCVQDVGGAWICARVRRVSEQQAGQAGADEQEQVSETEDRAKVIDR